MRRSRNIRLRDLPRLLVGGAVQFAELFGGRYRRTEGAHVITIDDHDRILVVRTTYLGPEWMLPGGHVERAETPHHAAARETREETGLDVRVERLLFVDAHKARNVSFIFAATVIGGELEPQLGEIAEAGWVDREEIAATSPRLHRLLERLDEADGAIAYLGLGPPRIEP